MNEIIKSIKDFMMNTNLDEQFYEAVVKRLETFGYEVKVDDAWTISFCIQKVENRIKSSCNILSIPDGLFNVAVDMTCGEFLFALKQTGKLELGDLDLSGAITELREGDTTIRFSEGSSEDEKFTMFLNYLLTRGESDFICYRRLRW